MNQKSIKFGYRTAIAQEAVDGAKFPILESQQTRAAQDFGEAIMKVKGWQTYNENGNVISECNFYILTAKELKELIRSYGGHI